MISFTSSTSAFLSVLYLTFSATFPAAQSQLTPFFSTVTRSAAAPVTLPLSGGLLHVSGFFVNASVGGQQLTLQVDTSYSSLIVPRHGCVGCRTGDHRYDPTSSKEAAVVPCEDQICKPVSNQCNSKKCFKCSKSGNCCVKDTENCAFNMFYGDGSSGNGTLYRDILRIGGLQTPLFFGAMHEESRNFELPYTDGVLGMAFKQGACHPACIPPAMDAIVNHTGIENVFTMCVSRFGGTLVLGAADKSLSISDYKYIPLQDAPDPNRFVIPAKPEWKIANRTVSVPSITAAVWSTATTQIAFSKSTFLNVLDHLMEHYCHIPDLCSTVSWFRPQLCSYIPEETVAAMPSITIPLIDQVAITLNPDDYLIKYRVVDGKRQRCVAMIATDSLLKKGYGLLLGAAVLKRYAVVFDRGAYRVGVAEANTKNCGPETGSEEGLPASNEERDKGVLLTADSAPALETDSNADIEEEQQLEEAEVCRAQGSCSSCAKQSNCSFGYQTGRCVPIHEASKMPYPFCTGAFCACFAVGGSGWYFGILIGGLLGIAIVFVLVLVYRKRQQRNRYQLLEEYEEQDIETF